MSKPLTAREKADVMYCVAKGLESQFEMYSWEDMLNDLELTPREKKFAMDELCYAVKHCNSKVRVEVSGGVAEVTENPNNVEIEIIDHDNLEKCA